MYPILARTRWFFIYSYTAVLAVGLLMSICILYWQSRETAVDRWLDGFLSALCGGILTGRLAFTFLEQGYYAERGEGVQNLWQVGLTFHAVVIGALLGLLIWSRLKQQSLWAFLHLLTPIVPLLFLFGWAACWLEGCAYGAETILSPWSSNLPDHLGVFAVRYQTQLAGALLSGALLILWRWLANGRFWQNGRLFFLLTALCFMTHAIITLFRGDEVILISSFRLDSMFDLVIVGFCLILLQYRPIEATKR